MACGSRTTRSCRRDGVTDTPEAARTYLHSIIGDVVAPERIDTYLERGPEMLSFVLKNSPLKLCWVPGYSDYYPESPGRQADRPVGGTEAVQRQASSAPTRTASSRRTARFR